MKIHECLHCGCHSFLVSVPVIQEWEVDAVGDYIHCLDKDVRPLNPPSDEDIWECPECGKKCKGKDLLVEGIKTIIFTDLDDEVSVYAEIVKEERECITIKPYVVSSAYKGAYPLPSAYDQQTFNIWYKEDGVVYVKDESNTSHLWTEVKYSFLSETVADNIRQNELKQLNERIKQTCSESKGD